MTERRIVLRIGALALALPSLLAAQSEKRFRVGFLVPSNEAGGKPYIDAFVSELRNLGYVAGRNLVVDVRHADGDSSRFPGLAEELIALKPDLLAGVEWTARALKAKTDTVPIVLTASTDPVGAGLIKSLARPGTNVTGLALRLDELIAKQIEILAEMVPGMARIGLLSYAAAGRDDPGAPIAAKWEESAMTATAARGLRLIVTQARDASTVRRAFGELESASAQGLVLAPVFTWFQLSSEILAQTRRLRLPSITALSPSWAQAGGLAYYGADVAKAQRLAAGMMDRILKGGNPAEIPVEHPASFEFVVNLRTARELAISIPPSMLLRADRVIE